MYRGMSYTKKNPDIVGSMKMNSIKNQRTQKEIHDSLELLSIRDLERLVKKDPHCYNESTTKAVNLLFKKYTKFSTHQAAENSLKNISDKKGKVAEMVKDALVGLETAYNKKLSNVSLDGRNITTIDEFKRKKVVAPPAKQKKTNKSKRYR